MLISMDNFMEIVLELRSHRQATAGVLAPPDLRDLDRRINCPQCGNRMDTTPTAAAATSSSTVASGAR
jgi:hypothetical protein